LTDQALADPFPIAASDTVMESYPGEKAGKSWLATIRDYAVMLWKAGPYINGLRDKTIVPIVTTVRAGQAYQPSLVAP
jgi:hypothetical protein